MNPAQIKEEFGNKLCFMDTIDEQKMLPFGTIDDLKKDIFKKIVIVGYNEGWILGTTHNVQNDTSIEKIEFFSVIQERLGNIPLGIT